MQIRPASGDDAPAIWSILEPIVRLGETLALPRDSSQELAVAHWLGPDRWAFVAEDDGQILGAYFIRANQLGGGDHVANAGYVTALEASGRGIAQQMCEHSLQQARERGFRAMQFNFVVSTNAPAVHLWQRCGFHIVGALPGAFRHPTYGDVDVLVMYQRLESTAPR
jgi:GNAT superfamily N-acetyltransferase